MSTEATTDPTPAAPVPSASGDLVAEWRPTTRHSSESSPLAARTGRERAALAVLLLATGVLYLWGLGASGYANDFYAAAVQAGTKSWKAFLFGSIDSANLITVDKPPASLWPMELSGRLFGFSSWSMLAPQALMGVAAVGLLYASVRRWFGPTAGLFAGALLAITPVAVLMFRFNNPDALMTLLIVLAAYCVTRAIDGASTRWLLVAGLVMGFSFLAKGLQPFTVLPALALGYLVAAPTPLRRRLLQLLAAGLAIVVGAGWWLLIVALTPAGSRPYIGGSGDNTALGLAFGYNGLSRLSGGSGPGGGAGGGGFSGATGVGRLFNSLNGGEISWLLPAAIVAVLALLVMSSRTARTDRTRAALIIWGGWLLVTGGVLSFAGGIIHTYYDVELAPAVAALVAIGAVTLWRQRAVTAARLGLAVGVLVTVWWSTTLLGRSGSWNSWLAPALVVLGLIGAIALLVRTDRVRWLAAAGAGAGLVAVAGGSAAYAVNTAGTPHEGSIPSAGPAGSTGSFGGFGGRPGGARVSFELPGGGFPGGAPGAGPLPGRGTAGGPPASGGRGANLPSRAGSAPSGAGGPGGGAATVNAAVVKLLKNAGTTWSAATIGAQSAAPLELQSGTAVMAIGGFGGSDPAPTLAQFERYVRDGKVHYFISGGFGGGGGPGGNAGTGSQITAWVQAHYSSISVGGSTVYDLTKAKA